jgi:hypothetical protein
LLDKIKSFLIDCRMLNVVLSEEKLKVLKLDKIVFAIRSIPSHKEKDFFDEVK